MTETPMFAARVYCSNCGTEYDHAFVMRGIQRGTMTPDDREACNQKVI